MIDSANFKNWLDQNTSFSTNVVSDTISRMRRADKIRAWDGESTYPFYLEKEEEFQALSVSVKSQIRKAVRLYASFSETGKQ
jgi:DNA (cytosine-5)-methyltransferase 1